MAERMKSKRGSKMRGIQLLKIRETKIWFTNVQLYDFLTPISFNSCLHVQNIKI